MQIRKYEIVNTALGWLCFAVAALTYLLTVEPTASFWDCPEFISQGAKLEVGHPPGNPIFMLAARFFVTLFGGEMSHAALAVNCMSALLSAATIMLLFWSITHLVRRLIVRDDAGSVSGWQLALIVGGGICGALAYTWSDTFWFSAVEGEVYAFSSFCTALVFWLMLKWENRADEPHSDRYLVLIAYVIGVSIAVHLLNLLCIPALGLIFYYRKWKNINATGSLIALGVSCVIVGAILYGLVPGFVQVAQWFELLFVNSFGLGYNMGVLIYAILLVAVFILTIRALYRSSSPTTVRLLVLASVGLSGMPFIGHSALVGTLVLIGLAVYLFGFCRPLPVRVLSLCVISIFVIFVGYSSYALLLIRASANTPMNQNAPDNVFALGSYLNREQYGDRPLFKGPVFAETFDEMEYPEGSGEFYIPVDEYGRPRTRVLDGYLRDERGAAFNSPEKTYTKVVKANPSQPDEYVKEIERPNYRTMSDLDMILTRIYSNDPEGRHVAGYKAWAGYNTPDIYTIPQEVRARWAEQGYAPKYELMPYLNHLEPVTTNIDSQTGESLLETPAWKPGFDVNLRYFLNYQLNHMYWRYFMWNFAGRQNDIQGNGEPHLGNWISGIPLIDNARLGDQSLLPDEFGKGNKGHNVFYMLPLILGLIGLLYQALYRHRVNPERGIQQFWVVFFLFFMTGIAIVLYLNQTPGQPRERDYAFAGSFYAFAIWIGMGVPAIGVLLRSLLSPKAKDGGEAADSKTARVASAAVACAIGLAVPLQMVSQTWDDHDRSGRYTTRDFGMNYLSSVDPNGIIFTNGDNDTFPLWYAQEVEGFRTDVRVVNLSYLTTDWYAHQMRVATDGAPGIPVSASPADYAYDRLQYSFFDPENMSSEEVSAATSLDDLYHSPQATYNGSRVMRYPMMYIPANAGAAARAGVIEERELPAAEEAIRIDLPNDPYNTSGGVTLSQALSLDMINTQVQNGWNRPAYFAMTVPDEFYLSMGPYMRNTGLAYQVTPLRNPEQGDAGNHPWTATDKMYRNVTGKFRWGGLDKAGSGDIYLDETVRRMVTTHRSAMADLAAALYLEGYDATHRADSLGNGGTVTEADRAFAADRYKKAETVLDLIGEKLPTSVAPYSIQIGEQIARCYIQLADATGKDALRLKGLDILHGEILRYGAYLPYFKELRKTLPASGFGGLSGVDRFVPSYLYYLLDDYVQAGGDTDALQKELAAKGVNLNDLEDYLRN